MRTSVVIIGSGFAGLGMAIQLAEQGRDDFVVLEKADSLGGTWRDNTYPGCACDVQSHLYSYSFAPNPNWTRMFAGQDEIRGYLEDLADRYRLRDRIRYGVTVTGAEFDAAEGGWTVHTASGETIETRFVVWGTGALHEPSIPEIEGLERFSGRVFHSANWDHDHDLAGRRVAVIGTGASAIQFLPPVAERAAELTLFQRTPPWILPKLDRSISSFERWAFRAFPVLQRLYRASIYTRLEGRVFGFRHPRVMTGLQALAKAHIRRGIADPELRAAVTPDYTLGCKRVLLSNDYYPALAQPNTEVITSALAEVRGSSVVTVDGIEREVDAIIFGTGFHVTDMPIADRLIGADGRRLSEHWKDGMAALRGCAVDGFPNLLLIIGPNTGLGNSSMILMIESSLNYMADYLRTLSRTGAAALDAKPSAVAAWTEQTQARAARTVWNTGGCKSWYLDANGRNTTAWPGTTAQFRRATRRLELSEYEVLAPVSADAHTVGAVS